MDKQAQESGRVPFSFFVSLLHEISKYSSRKPQSAPKSANLALTILARWITKLRQSFSPLPPGTTAIVFRLLFPQDDSRRKYDMQETRLAQELVKCFGISKNGRGESLRKWKGETTLGCLGDEVKKVLDQATSNMECHINQMSITEVDTLLDELASTSVFSDASLRNGRARRSRYSILCNLYSSMSPLDASFLTQIILKDLRPLLFPLIEAHYTTALTRYNTTSVVSLSKEDAMKVWDPSGLMLKIYKVRASLHEAANVFETSNSCDKTPHLKPTLRTPIEIPKSVKGRGCNDALRHFAASDKVWAETKYDGERAQIHVEVRDDGSSHITIFSKSKRDSTLDRYGVHGIIRDALGLTKNAIGGGNYRSNTIKNVILDAEMVAFSDRLHKIDEFWRIRSLVTNTARGARSTMFFAPQTEPDNNEECVSQASLMSDASDNGTRHLALVFFDILFLNSVSLLSAPYSSRRSTLESIIHMRPGHAMLADRTPIVLNGPRGANDAAEHLRTIWARIIAECSEGLVLKAEEGRYNDYWSPWVKLKKDYIPGYGDTVDLVVVAASWEKDRARELRVAPTAYTTFYVGALANADTLKLDPASLPHFEIYFTVSYGLDRVQLEQANFLIKSSYPLQYNPSRKAPKGLPYTFNIYSGLTAPAVLFQEPFLAELYGAGFTKAPRSKYYELRFPRLTKLYCPSSRPWSEGVTLQDLHKIACESIGRNRTEKEVEDWTKEVWGEVASPGVRCKRKRKEKEATWLDRLGVVDGAMGNKRMRLMSSSSSPSSSHEKAPELQDPPAKLRNGEAQLMLDMEPPGFTLNLELLPTPPPSNPGRVQVIRAKEDKPLDSISPPSTRRITMPEKSCFCDCSRNISGPEAGTSKCKPVQPIFHLGDEFTPFVTLSPPILADSKSVYVSKPIVIFLRDAFVWFAQPCNTPRPTWRPATQDLVAASSRLHSLESLMLGCGWQSGNIPSRMKYGVVFVDDSTASGRSWKEYALRTLQEKHASLTPGTGAIPIWVFKANVLEFEALEQEVNVDVLALWRFD